jgi:hypothetical protein
MLVAKRILQTNLNREEVIKVFIENENFNISLKGNTVRISETKNPFFNPKATLGFKCESNYTFVNVESITTSYEIYLLVFVNLFNFTILIGNIFGLEILAGFHEFGLSKWLHFGFLVLFNLLLIIGFWYEKKHFLGSVQALLHTNSRLLKSSELYWSFENFKRIRKSLN